MSGEVLAPGRRERKKSATRAALRGAALRLAVRDGIEHLTAERIADEADVALRTFFNYFSSKEEAVLAASAAAAEALVDTFRARPPAESVLTALREAVLAVMDREDVTGRDHLEVLRLIRTTPSLLPQQLSVLTAQEQDLAAAITDRVGAGSGDGVYPRLCAAAAFATLRVTLDRWLDRTAERGGPPSIALLRGEMGAAFAELAAGLDRAGPGLDREGPGRDREGPGREGTPGAPPRL